MSSVNQRFFIIGAQRSGTTMLMLILNAHSKICVTREAEFLMPFLKWKYVGSPMSGHLLKNFYQNYFSTVVDLVKFQYAHFNEFFSSLSDTEKLLLREFIDRLFTDYAEKEGKNIWGNKTPLFIPKIPLLLHLFPDAKFIYLMRDARDVYNSRRKLRPIDNDPIVNAIDWTIKQYLIGRHFKKIPMANRVVVRYEDLLDNPEESIGPMCKLLGVEFEDSMLDFYKTSKEHLAHTHSRWIFEPLKKDNQNKWKTRLTPSEIKIFNLICGHYLKKYGYEVSGGFFDISFIKLFFNFLVKGLPNKISELLERKRIFNRSIKQVK